MSALLSLLISLSWSKDPVTGLLLCLAEPRFLFSSSCSLLIGIRKRLAYPVASTSPEEDGLHRDNVAQHSQYAVHHNFGRKNKYMTTELSPGNGSYILHNKIFLCLRKGMMVNVSPVISSPEFGETEPKQIYSRDSKDFRHCEGALWSSEDCLCWVVTSPSWSTEEDSAQV